MYVHVGDRGHGLFIRCSLPISPAENTGAYLASAAAGCSEPAWVWGGWVGKPLAEQLTVNIRLGLDTIRKQRYVCP